MARIEALKQQRFVETSNAPVTSFQLTGGVPKMHPLKSSNPVFKATNLIHSVKIKKPKLKLKMPKMHL
jgi:hypothetical protein